MCLLKYPFGGATGDGSVQAEEVTRLGQAISEVILKAKASSEFKW